MNDSDALLTIKEASRDYFQGKVSGRELTKLFHAGQLAGFRVGTGRKRKILLYKSGLDAYRLANANHQPLPASEPGQDDEAERKPLRPQSRPAAGPCRLPRLPSS